VQLNLAKTDQISDDAKTNYSFMKPLKRVVMMTQLTSLSSSANAASGFDGETIEVDQQRVACDGGGGALGHPRVWLHLGEEHRIACTYCSRVYVKRQPDANGS
jgi:uncharacterized Zn-finger protein